MSKIERSRTQVCQEQDEQQKNLHETDHLAEDQEKDEKDDVVQDVENYLSSCGDIPEEGEAMKEELEGGEHEPDDSISTDRQRTVIADHTDVPLNAVTLAPVPEEDSRLS